MTGGKDACWPWTRELNSKGRPYYTVDGKKKLAYRVVWELTFGEELGDRVFRHTCDNPACCNPYHGIAGTHEENMNDMKTRERHGLSHHMIRSVRKLLASGTMTHQQIADFTGLAKTTISEINTGKNYAHVEDEPDV